MDIQLHNSSDKLSVSDAVFGADYKEALVHQVVTAYMAGARSGTKAQKNRSEVSGGGKKPWRQKGTGRARAGTIRSPLWRTGGVTFAAKPRDFSQKVNRKMYRGAIRSILSELARRGDLVVANEFSVAEPKTKAFIAEMNKLETSSVLVVTAELDKNLHLAARNLRGAEVIDAEAVNPVVLLSYAKVLITADAVKKLEAHLA